jgi:hypothetical protein
MTKQDEKRALKFWLHFLKHSTYNQTLDSVLGHLRQVISNVSNERDDLSGLPDYELHAAEMDLADEVESVLGLAFVACQAHITNVVSNALKMHSIGKLGVDLFGGKANKANQKKEILRRGGFPTDWSPQVQGDDPTTILGKWTHRYSPVEVINAFANYFKHQDEWTVDFKRKGKHLVPFFVQKKSNQYTLDVIEAFGAQPLASGNLRRAAAELGNPELLHLETMGKILEYWTAPLHRLYEQEMKHLGILD